MHLHGTQISSQAKLYNSQLETHSHISHLGVKIIIEFNKVVSVWWNLILPNCPAVSSPLTFFPSCIKWRILRFQLTFDRRVGVGGHSPSQFQPLGHVPLNYVFISFAVNRKLRHTHGSQVNKWRSFPLLSNLQPLIFFHPSCNWKLVTQIAGKTQ